MKKLFLLLTSALLMSAAAFALDPITGITTVCSGSYGYLSDSTSPGGIWTSSDTIVAYIGDATTGVVLGSSPGTATITYTVGGSSVTTTFTVTTPAAPIYGPTSGCPGTTVTLTDATSGGVWSSSDASIATISSTGVLTAVSVGTAYIYYTTGPGCYAYIPFSVTTSGGFVDSLFSPATVCVGSTITATDASVGGSWSVSDASVATIDGSGVITGVSAGSVIISYAVTSGCLTGLATRTIGVIDVTSAGTLSGPSTVSVGSSIYLSSSVSSGTFSSSDSLVASVDPLTGMVIGEYPGTATITYTVTCGSSVYTTTFTVTVTSANIISGQIFFPSTPYYGLVKVWLITLTGTDLEAVDSTVVGSYGDSTFYNFIGAATDSYRIKAAILDTMGLSSSYIPTYHTSSYYWYDAAILAHIAGTSDFNQDINMVSGTPTTGPGFIGGDVTTGANKATASGEPVKGLIMYAVNSATNQLMQSVRTDATGHYSFSNLPVGQTYFIFPDSLNYMTTAYTSIALTTGSPSLTTASFIQHTISKTITPVTPEGVINVTATGASVIVFPNPAVSKLNIQWNALAAEQAAISVSDVTGREVYKTKINLQQGIGGTQLDLSSFVNGLYVVSVRSASINYSSKVQVQH